MALEQQVAYTPEIAQPSFYPHAGSTQINFTVAALAGYVYDDKEPDRYRRRSMPASDLCSMHVRRAHRYSAETHCTTKPIIQSESMHKFLSVEAACPMKVRTWLPAV